MPGMSAGGEAFESVLLVERKRADTERQRLLAELLSAQARYHRVFDGMAEAILVHAPDGSCLDANHAAVQLTGYAHEELRRMRAGDLSASPERAGAEWQRIRDGGQCSCESELRCRDGSVVPVETRFTSVTLDTGIIFLSSMRDISERRAFEALQRDFIAMVGHELRNPLSSIQGSAHTMRLSGQFNARGVDRILWQTRQLERLITDLVDANHIDRGRLQLRRERSDLTAFLRACADEAAALSSSHQVRVEGPEGPLDGLWDADRVAQVVRNLLSNAIKYSPDGGEVLVKIEASATIVDVSITDHGVGIAPEAVPRLFDRFYRASGTAERVRGMGVGLYVCKQLIEAHGGTISVASQLGKGTTIRFRLPRDGSSDPRT